MEYTKLGRSDIKVSRICLGSMTWGVQNTEAEGHAQMDYALGRGINFIDVAEMYPISPSAKTYGDTERIIGTWLKARKNRDKMVIATKVIGPSNGFPYIRDGAPRLDRKNIEAAIDASLQRLQTDYVDLYQVHWPERPVNMFGKLDFPHEADKSGAIAIEETLSVLADLVKAGKVRTIGISNETPWGVMRYTALAKELNAPRIVSIQNPYNLINRTFEVGLSEVALAEDVGLLAYSPLGGGTLSGKYIGGAQPEGARLSLWPGRYDRYTKGPGLRAIEAYVALAKECGLDPSMMANAFVYSRNFVTASIIGATSMAQLKDNIDASELVLSAEVMKKINQIHAEIPNPAP